MQSEVDPVYVLEQGSNEYERLIRQSGMFAPATRRLMVEAGIGPGMRVLDIGCGVGDVSLLCADLVGPTGSVVGIDREASAVELARIRASQADHGHLSFLVGDYRELAISALFDAIVGRLVLMYAADPTAAVYSLLSHVRPGGVVAFHEMNSEVSIAHPPSPTYSKIVGWWREVCSRAGIDREMGPKLYSTLADAGVVDPRVHVEAFVGGGPDFPGYAYMAGVARSLVAVMPQLGLVPPPEPELASLEEQFRREVVEGGGSVTLQMLYGGWGRVPLDAL